MTEPSPRASRLALTAGIVAIAVVGGGGFLLGQRTAREPPTATAPTPVAAVPAPAPSASAAPGRTFDRAGLIALAAFAADATARGAAVPADVRDAVGSPFSIALPFGCDGAASADSEADMRWRYDDTAKALRLHVAPLAWTPAEWLSDGTAGDIETIEGFWIPRPWTGSEACPAARGPIVVSGTEPVTLPGQTLAVAQLFGPDASRQGRRDGKAYTAVLRMAPDAVRPEQGFRLRLTGRVTAAPNGAPVVCRQPGGAEQRPVCLVVTALDTVAIENTGTGETLVSWQTGAARTGDARP